MSLLLQINSIKVQQLARERTGFSLRVLPRVLDSNVKGRFFLLRAQAGGGEGSHVTLSSFYLCVTLTLALQNLSFSSSRALYVKKQHYSLVHAVCRTPTVHGRSRC